MQTIIRGVRNRHAGPLLTAVHCTWLRKRLEADQALVAGNGRVGRPLPCSGSNLYHAFAVRAQDVLYILMTALHVVGLLAVGYWSYVNFRLKSQQRARREVRH